MRVFLGSVKIGTSPYPLLRYFLYYTLSSLFYQSRRFRSKKGSPKANISKAVLRSSSFMSPVAVSDSIYGHLQKSPRKNGGNAAKSAPQAPQSAEKARTSGKMVTTKTKTVGSPAKMPFFVRVFTVQRIFYRCCVSRSPGGAT